MIYQWSELESVFNKIDLEIFDVDLEIESDSNIYKYNCLERIGSVGKTTWYFPLSKTESKRLGVDKNNCGIKIIKYPVYADIIDEYHRLLTEYSIQKILTNHEMAPDIYKLIFVKIKKEIQLRVDWLSQLIVFPKNSIFFAQIVENIDNQGFDNFIPTTANGIPYGKMIQSFVSKCYELRIMPYDINDENLFYNNEKLKVVDVHKWKRSYTINSPLSPKYVQIELNNSCNANCKMCNIPNMTRRKGKMSDELFLKILQEAKENKVEYITPFLHGEPFLRDDFIDKLQMINDYVPEAKITIFTNASMLNEEKLHRLSEIKNIEQLVFSFPGGTKEVYEKVTELNFENSVKNIKNAFSILKNTPMRISMPKYKDNESTEEDFYLLWKGYPCSTYDTYNYLGNVDGTLSDICYEHCDRAFRSMTILYDGRVCLCCMDSDGDYIMGDISWDSMVEIWNNENYSELRRLHGICRNAYKPCNMCTLDLKTEEYKNAFSNNNM